MEYPKKFKERVKKAMSNFEVFPGHSLYDLLEEGNEFVGRVLDDSRYGAISCESFIEAYESKDPNKMKALYERAQRKVEIEALYDEWYNLYQAHKKRLAAAKNNSDDVINVTKITCNGLFFVI